MSNTAGMDGNNKSTSTAYSVFAEVDELVSKPVLGTDGALAWQEFKKNTTSKGNSGITRSRGNAPQMPLKKADKLGTGLVSFSAERTNEENIRKAEGKAESECETLRQLLVPMWNWMENAARVRLGLLILCEAPRIEAERQKSNEDNARNKLNQMAMQRIRPDDVRYFISSDTFDGWKKDYIFTTRDRGTGYYWDGMDSCRAVKMIFGDQSESNRASSSTVGSSDTGADESIGEQLLKKKKKKRKKEDMTSLDDAEGIELTTDSNNPLEQVAQAIAKRNALVATKMAAASSSSPSCNMIQYQAHEPSSGRTTATSLNESEWSTATDVSTGKVYYYHKVTKETRWDNPVQIRETLDTIRKQGGVGNDTVLPTGWKTASVKNGKCYYYHEDGRTSWKKPSIK